MALGAHTFVTFGIGTEVVDQGCFAQFLPSDWVLVFPSPMNTFYELATGFIVTTEASLGDFWSAGKWTFKFLEF